MPKEGPAGRGRPPEAAARRAGLEEFVEKLLTSAMVALLDSAEREHASPTPRTIASLVELVALLVRVVLVAVAVAQRRLGPSSSATTSTVDRALPSSAVQVCWLEPDMSYSLRWIASSKTRATSRSMM
jgi:hypothetical protein